VPTDESTDLYSELVTIGRKEKTIRPEALLRYEHLLDCPEVSRRAGALRARAHLAVCANEALDAAVASIVSADIRLVAEAALCTTKDFEGLRVSERIHKLIGITDNMFKYRRGLAFGYVVTFLTRQAPSIAEAETQHVGTLSAQRSNDENGYLAYFRVLAERAARLHYAGLGALFAYDFDDELRANGIEIWELDVFMPRTTLADYLFQTYIRFVYDAIALRYFNAPLTHKYLSAGTVDRLLFLWQAVADGSPAGPHNVTDEQKRDLTAYAPLGLESDTLRDVYRTKWHRWLQGRGLAINKQNPKEAITRTKDDFLGAVVPITAASGAFVTVLTRYVRFDVPIHSQARIMTHKALASCYDFDEWTPIAGGKPLRYRTDAYFDSESPALTNSALV
jgi:hypothetical protein